MSPTLQTPITYPTITVGGTTFQLRFSHTAWYKLQSWGFTIGDPDNPIPIQALAAASAGTVDRKTGKWQSSKFASVEDFTDLMDETCTIMDLVQPVQDSIVKVAPTATVQVNQPTAEAPQTPVPVN